jgi:pimeloyl-ACP methyl ester carboxylesterase
MKADVAGGSIHYETAGESGPALLLVHGLGGSSKQWAGAAALLSPVCRLLIPDLRGHGESAKPAGPYSVKGWADDLAALCKTAGVDRAVAVGASVAGAVVLQLAADHPELVRGVVPVGGFPVLPPAGKERMAQRAATVEREGMAAAVDAVIAGALGATTHATKPDLVASLRAGLLANDPKAYAGATRAVVAADVQGELPRVSCPVLLVFGVEEKVAPLPAQAALKKALPQAQLRAIPAAGHLPFIEQPGPFAAAVMEFVAALP